MRIATEMKGASSVFRPAARLNSVRHGGGEVHRRLSHSVSVEGIELTFVMPKMLAHWTQTQRHTPKSKGKRLPPDGIEPSTFCLRDRRSATEL